MDKKIKDAAIDAALFVMNPYGTLFKRCVDLAEEAVKKDELSARTMQELREFAERKELEQRIDQAKAKAAQEYAIAARIQTAAEVEMEEYFEYVGEGGLGITGNVNTGDVGAQLGGGVRRLSKRVYRFKGNIIPDIGDRDTSLTVIEA